MDHHAFAAGRILQLVSAWDDSTCPRRKEVLYDEIRDMLDGVTSMPGCGSEKVTSAFALSAATQVARRKLGCSDAFDAPKELVAAPKPTQPEKSAGPKRNADSEVQNSRKAHDAELSAIREILGHIRSKATDLRSQVKHGEALVTHHVEKVSGVVQGVSDADRRLSTHAKSSAGAAVRLVLAVPVVGPLLAPVAGMVVQVLLLLLVVGTTLATITVMIFVAKPR